MGHKSQMPAINDLYDNRDFYDFHDLCDLTNDKLKTSNFKLFKICLVQKIQLLQKHVVKKY